jgi:multiple sugar transport system permease protein
MISYYLRKRLVDLVISTVMLIILAVTLLPIVWMIYSSLKDSTDIAVGKVGLRRAPTDILQMTMTDGQLLVLTANGGLNLYDPGALHRLQSTVYKTAATSYWLDEQFIWIASVNRGLLQVSRKDFDKFTAYPLPTRKIDFRKVQTTYLTGEGDKLWLAVEARGWDRVWQFNKATRRFDGFAVKRRTELFRPPDRLVPVALPREVDSEILSQVVDGNNVYLGAVGGELYKYDLTAKQLLAQVRVPSGHLLVRFENYIDMWKNVNFGLYLKNSLIICGFTMFFAMIIATLAAYALSRFRFPGADLFSNTVLATQMIPMIMYLIPIYIMFVKFTLLTGLPVKGTYFGIILIYSAWFIPFSIWILRGFFAAIPKELEEAALIDGCSRLAVFWRIALPLARPGIIATGVYVFLNAWDELMFAWVLTNSSTMTIPVGIRLFVGNYQNRFDLMMAAATVATLPVVVLFFMLQRHIVRGLTAGAVKG